MAKELKVLLEEDLLDNLNIALQINNDNINDVADKVFRNYIVKTFSSAASKIEKQNISQEPLSENLYYGKAIHKIPKWAKKPEQINFKIIRAYLQLAESGIVSYDELFKKCSNPKSDVYVATFSPNFSQMKFDGEKSHGKVFIVDESNNVYLWDAVKDVITKYKDLFLK